MRIAAGLATTSMRRASSGSDAVPVVDQDVRREVEHLIGLLEATLPANPSNPRNAPIENALRGDLVSYFKGLELALTANEELLRLLQTGE